MRFWGLTGLNVVLLALFAAGWRPQSGDDRGYPARPVRLVVPFSAGGATDAFARIIKSAVDDHQLLPQPLVIDNRGGAGATIGSRFVKSAPPDGYTVLLLHDAIFTARYSGLVEYGPEAFDPIAATGEAGMVIAVGLQSPYRSLDELMDAAAEQPETLRFGANIGALTHFAGLQLEKAFPGARFRFPQVGGGAERFAQLKGGHIDVSGFAIDEFLRFREGLRGLAYLGESPHPAAPEIPIAQLPRGQNIVSKNSYYWWAPRGTPQERIDILADAISAAMQTDYALRKLKAMECDPVFKRGEELRAHLAEVERRIASIEFPPSPPLPDYPKILLIGMGLLLPVIVVNDWRQSRRRRRAVGDDSAPVKECRGLAAAVLLLTAGYLGLLTGGWLAFRGATLLYVLAVGSVLARFDWRRLPAIGVLAQLLALGIPLVFEQLLEVTLP